MPAYQFTAIDASGKQQKGVLEGDSARQIRQQLRDKEWIPVSVDTVEQKDKHSGKQWFQKKITAYDLALLTRQLSVLVAAAIPLEEAVRAVGKQSEKAHVQNLLMSVRSKVLEGYSLANALQQSGRFPDLYCHHCRRRAFGAFGFNSGTIGRLHRKPLCHAEKNSRGDDLSHHFNADVFCDCDGFNDLCRTRYC